MGFNKKFTLKDLVKRFGWLAVLCGTLAMSNYSLFYIGRHLGTPVVFAVLGGVIFDGAALVFADISLSHARLGSSGSGSRLAVIMCAALSAYLNSLHTVFAHQIPAAKLWWAAPPIIAVAAYEAHIRFERRRALAANNRVAPDLPAMGKLAWVLFPIKTWKIARTIVRYRLGLLLSRHTPGMVHPNPPVPVPGSPELPAGSGVSEFSYTSLTGNYGQTPESNSYQRELNPGTTQHVREWALARGYNVGRRGTLPANVLRDYQVALTTVSEPVADTEPADTDTEHPDDTEELSSTMAEIDGNPVTLSVVRKVNGYDG